MWRMVKNQILSQESFFHAKILESVSSEEKYFQTLDVSSSIYLLLKEQGIEDKVGSFRPEMARSETFRGAANQFEPSAHCNIGLETFDFYGKFFKISFKLFLSF